MNSEINCKNCAAPLHGDRCEYCGTEYLSKPEISFPILDAADVVNTLFNYVGIAPPTNPRIGDVYYNERLQQTLCYCGDRWDPIN